MKPELATRIERTILIEAYHSYDFPESRLSRRRCCAAYLRGIRDAKATTMDEGDLWYSLWYSYMIDIFEHVALKTPIEKLPAAPVVPSL